MKSIYHVVVYARVRVRRERVVANLRKRQKSWTNITAFESASLASGKDCNSGWTLAQYRHHEPNNKLSWSCHFLAVQYLCSCVHWSHITDITSPPTSSQDEGAQFWSDMAVQRTRAGQLCYPVDEHAECSHPVFRQMVCWPRSCTARQPSSCHLELVCYVQSFPGLWRSHCCGFFSVLLGAKRPAGHIVGIQLHGYRG